MRTRSFLLGWIAFGALAGISPAIAKPLHWSLPRPAIGLWAPSGSGRREMFGIFSHRPAPAGATSSGSTGSGLSIAPSIDNILNDRHAFAVEQTGLAGDAGYLRPVGRTFGVALKKRFF